jgi:hypothetical protein
MSSYRMEEFTAMAKAKKAKADVINLAAFRETRSRAPTSQSDSQEAPPQQQELQDEEGRPIWSHAKLAAWCLWQSAKNSIYTPKGFYTEDSFTLTTAWETQFLGSMLTWQGNPTPRQCRCLERIRDKIIAAVEPPNPAA